MTSPEDQARAFLRRTRPAHLPVRRNRGRAEQAALAQYPSRTRRHFGWPSRPPRPGRHALPSPPQHPTRPAPNQHHGRRPTREAHRAPTRRRQRAQERLALHGPAARSPLATPSEGALHRSLGDSTQVNSSQVSPCAAPVPEVTRTPRSSPSAVHPTWLPCSVTGELAARCDGCVKVCRGGSASRVDPVATLSRPLADRGTSGDFVSGERGRRSVDLHGDSSPALPGARPTALRGHTLALATLGRGRWPVVRVCR